MSDQQSVPVEVSASIELQDKLAGEKAVLIDVRTPAEFQSVHAVGAVNLPLDQVDAEMVKKIAGQSEVYVICKGGPRSRQAAKKLAESDLSSVVIDGGTDAWVNQGLNVVKGKQTMSLERQVRIAAGSLVLLGVLLSFSVPYTIWLSAFVGAGLVFAGVTDTCGMGLMLAKMPWNRV